MSDGEEFRLYPVAGHPGFGALGRFDPLGSATPAAGAFAVLELETVVGTESCGRAACKGAERQPPVGDRSESQHAVIVVVIIVESVLFDLFTARRLGLHGEAMRAGRQPGSVGEEEEGREPGTGRASAVAKSPVG